MRLLIADDHELLRDMLENFLGQQQDIDILTVPDLDAAEQALATEEPFDLVLLDYAMPGAKGLDGLQRLLEAENAPPIALISGLASLKVARDAILMGARGFLHKSMPAQSLLNALRFMVQGERFLPVDFVLTADEPPAMPKRSAEPATGQSMLTARERDVLRALCEGFTNKEIARVLGLREPTVKLHVKTLYRRLGAANRTQAAMIAKSEGYC